MTQLILDVGGENMTLPESIKGGYNASLVPLNVDVEMISGRLTRELRGHVWEISYQYGYFNDSDKEKLLGILDGAQTVVCGFLKPHDSELSYSEFLVTGINYPRFMWSREGDALWGDFSFTLREVKPS